MQRRLLASDSRSGEFGTENGINCSWAEHVPNSGEMRNSVKQGEWEFSRKQVRKWCPRASASLWIRSDLQTTLCKSQNMLCTYQRIKDSGVETKHRFTPTLNFIFGLNKPICQQCKMLFSSDWLKAISFDYTTESTASTYWPTQIGADFRLKKKDK